MSALPLAIKPGDLPTPPKVALEIMRACSRDNASNADLGALAARDTSPTVETLRIVNSAWYGFRDDVGTVAHAAVILGQRALHHLVLCIAVRDTLKGTRIANFDATMFAEDSLRRAVAARLLAPIGGVDPEEAFTAGLLQDFGLIALFIAHPGGGLDFADLRKRDPRARLTFELEHFGIAHDAAGEWVAESWEFPVDLRQAIATHHQCDSAECSSLSTLLYCADWLAAVYEVEEHGPCLADCRTELGNLLGLSADRVDEFLAAVPEEVSRSACELGVETGKQVSFDALMRETNATLAEENLSYQELTLRLKNTLRERDRLAAELDRELEQARAIQRALLPRPMPDDLPIAGINVSAKKLSGDFYDFFPLGEDRIFFCLGDVSGKGANAAITMTKVAGLCRCLARQNLDLGELMDIVNREVVETSAHGMFVTLVAGIFDATEIQVRLVNAGHLPTLLLLRDQKPRLLTAQAPPLGVLDDIVFPETQHSIAGGDLYLFSDGITECRRDDGTELDIGGLLELLVKSRDKSPRDQLTHIVSLLLDSKREAKDDLTLVRLHAG